jgi:hypothetical protein
MTGHHGIPLGNPLRRVLFNPFMSKQQRMRQGKPRNTGATGGMGQRVAAPAASARAAMTGQPKVSTVKGGIRVSHTEAVDLINGTTSFLLRTYEVNPGNPDVFPWLSTKAAGYEQYKFESLTFHYETRTSTDRAGAVTGAFDYDVYDAQPTSATNMLSYRGAAEGVAWSPLLSWSADAKRAVAKLRYIRNVHTVHGDQRMYDLANFYVATDNFASTELAGRLMVTYSVFMLYEHTDSDQASPTAGSYGQIYQILASGEYSWSTGVDSKLVWTLGNGTTNEPPDKWNGLGVVLSSTSPTYTGDLESLNIKYRKRLLDCKNNKERMQIAMERSLERAKLMDFSKHPLRVRNDYSLPKDQRQTLGDTFGTFFTFAPGHVSIGFKFDSSSFTGNVTTDADSYVVANLMYQDASGTTGLIHYATIEKYVSDASFAYFQLQSQCVQRNIVGRIWWIEFTSNDGGYLGFSDDRNNYPCISITRA